MTASPAIEVAGPAAFPPAWAGGWGQDRAGFYVEVVVGEAAIELRWIAPGEFQMGSRPGEGGRDQDEGRHLVRLTRGFWIGRYPVTQAEYATVMGKNPSRFKGDRRPVENVSWDDAAGFCGRLTTLAREAGVVLEPGFCFRLPTEAEWEYACRAGTGSAFNDGSPCTEPTGKDPALELLGWYQKNSGNETHPVGERKPNAWGLYDMHGNVWEWCEDRAGGTGAVVTDTYLNGIEDPRCTQGARRVVRGGCFWFVARRCRSAYRHACEPDLRDENLGFRLAAGQELGSGAAG